MTLHLVRTLTGEIIAALEDQNDAETLAAMWNAADPADDAHYFTETVEVSTHEDMLGLVPSDVNLAWDVSWPGWENKDGQPDILLNYKDFPCEEGRFRIQPPEVWDAGEFGIQSVRDYVHDKLAEVNAS